MMRWLILGLVVSIVSIRAAVREVSFYCPQLTTEAPRVDGVLDDDCWQKAEKNEDCYEYLNINPSEGLLRTVYQMVYDAKGLYVAVVNYEKSPASLQLQATSRDDQNLWHDDCCEFYIDHQANGPGYRKFTVNAKGVMADMLRIDGNVVRNEWNGQGWTAKTRIEKDRWILEVFFPWPDLGRVAAPGEVWRFCMTRFGWSTGKFIGTTSSPGGSYVNTGNFGYLCFMTKGTNPKPEELGAILEKHVTPPWGTVISDRLVLNTGGRTTYGSLSQALAGEQAVLGRLVSSWAVVPAQFTDACQQLRCAFERWSQCDHQTFLNYRMMGMLKEEAEELSWKINLSKDFGE